MNEATKEGLTRREALAAAIGGAAAVALPACETTPAHAEDPAGPGKKAASARMPVAYVPHGGGPWPFVDVGFGDRAELDGLAAYLRGLAALPPRKPDALLVVSAHWEEPAPTVMSGERPPLLFDYYGFPPESYQLTWPAPGHPKIAARARQLLEGAGFATAENKERGFDHGTFVPLKLTYPEAEIPVVQLSLKRGLDPAEHLAMGRALAPLRDEGVFIVGSGMSFHNMGAFRGGGRGALGHAAAFDGWLQETMALPSADRDGRLSQWASAPSARQAHPREEHLLPLMVVAGAAGADRGLTAYRGSIIGLRLSGYHFG
jgi:aromatic ring-opening dioxygenase catalytic subunit (LigB family)